MTASFQCNTWSYTVLFKPFSCISVVFDSPSEELVQEPSVGCNQSTPCHLYLVALHVLWTQSISMALQRATVAGHDEGSLICQATGRSRVLQTSPDTPCSAMYP